MGEPLMRGTHAHPLVAQVSNHGCCKLPTAPDVPPAFPLLEEHPNPAEQLLKNKQVLGLASGSFKLCLPLCRMWTEVLSYRASWWGEEEG